MKIRSSNYSNTSDNKHKYAETSETGFICTLLLNKDIHLTKKNGEVML